jgi:prepilin-type N-terminal cleavage/methylation domain-containing protein
MASSITRRSAKQVKARSQRGFSLLEVVISMAILTVGLVSLLGVFALAMASTQTSQQDMIAKQLANEALESIVTARNSSQIAWNQIQNMSGGCPSTTGGPIFMSGQQPIYNAGNDGIFGTCDDAAALEETLKEPGPDGIYGNADDIQIPLTSYQRTILISPVVDASGNVVATLRGINITVQYQTTQTRIPKTYVLSTLISQYQ